MMETQQFRAEVLARHGASPDQVRELLAYNENPFDYGMQGASAFPLDDEPFIEAWKAYAEEAVQVGAFACLRRKLVQLQFPIEEGISNSEVYKQATRRGIAHQRKGLVLEEPERLRIDIHPTPAGRIPLLITAHRADFVMLVRALTRRNEPAAIPDSMGACMVAGYNNWDRVRTYRRTWERHASHPTEAKWKREFKRLIPKKDCYQDRFIILSDGPYSAVSAGVLGLTGVRWRSLSLAIRREHECVHYFTRRVFASMRNNVLDELIADYVGIVAATGEFQAAWLLRFLGLEAFPAYRAGARLENYRGDPPLSDGAFRVLQSLVVHAVRNIKRFCNAQGRAPGGAPALLILSRLTLEELASPEAVERMQGTYSVITSSARGAAA